MRALQNTGSSNSFISFLMARQAEQPDGASSCLISFLASIARSSIVLLYIFDYTSSKTCQKVVFGTNFAYKQIGDTVFTVYR